MPIQSLVIRGSHILAAASPSQDDLIHLLAHPEAWDPEGHNGQPGYVLRGCIRNRTDTLVWVAYQCTHSHMSNHLTGSNEPTMPEFLLIVKPRHDIEMVPRNFHPDTYPNLRLLVQQLNRKTLRTRLGPFPKRVRFS